MKTSIFLAHPGRRPRLVTPDELADPDDLEPALGVNGEQIWKGRTSSMAWSAPELVSVPSGLRAPDPGDVIFTSTPAGPARRNGSRAPARW